MTPKQTAKLTKEQYERFEEKFTDSEYDREGNRVGYFLLDDYHEDVKQFLADELQRQREEILKILQSVEDIAQDEKKHNWADHCSCLRYAIWKVENPNNDEDGAMAYASTLQTTNEEQK